MQIVCKYKIHYTMKPTVTTAILLDTRRAKKNGTYPVKLRVTHHKTQKYYPTKYSYTKEEFGIIMSLKPGKKFKKASLQINKIETTAREVIDELTAFSFSLFEKKFLSKVPRGKQNDVYYKYQLFIEEKKIENAGTGDLYQTALNSLKSYSEQLTFHEVTPEFLKGYEKWMQNKDKSRSRSTVGIYLKPLKSVFNKGISEGTIHKDLYPFGKGKYQLPSANNIKKALQLSDIEKIFFYEPQTPSEHKYRDLWLFSYLANGMNMKDILRLRYRDLEENCFYYYREKIDSTSRVNRRPVQVPLTSELKNIINKWGSKPVTPDALIFPYLGNSINDIKELARRKQVVKQINKYMRRIAKNVGIQKDVTTYVARHSFATVLKRSGASIEFISESLGHKDIRTTEHYLDSFEDDMKMQYANALTNFESKKENEVTEKE